MIITEFVEVKRNGNNKLPYFRSLGYDTDNLVFLVKIDHLPKTSLSLVIAKCDYCNEIIENITYKNYCRNFKRGGKYACSSKCTIIKTKKTNLEKYGFESPQKNSDIKEKTKKTNLEKYGSEFTFQFLKDKIEKTNLEKYGFKNPFSNEEIKNKIKKTNLERYGSENPSFSENIKSKILKNQRKTNLEKYNVENVFSLKEVKDTIKNTKLKKYGKSSLLQNEDFRKLHFKISNHNNYIKYVDNSISLFKCDNGLDHNFEINSDNYIKRIKHNNPLCTVCYPIGDHKSIKEKELLSYIKSIYSGEIVSGYRDGLEIDIYLPELKVGFEFNGLYWHCEIFKSKNYHLDKTNHFKNKGIRLIHIWEDDWTFKQKTVKSQISNLFGLNVKIWARKCKIEIIEVGLDRTFLNENHIQGSVNSVIKLGLYYSGELVSLMTFDNFEGRKKMEDGGWNLSRFCNVLNTNVVGGASKLLNHFIKNYNPSRIISYADKNWSLGDLYYQLGFNLISETKPDYKYIVNGKRVHKSRFKKNKLKTDLSESQYMSNMYIDKVYDCGKIKFEKISNNHVI
jgi:hypothetical protein